MNSCILHEELSGVEQSKKATLFVLDGQLSQGARQFAYRRCINGEHEGEIKEIKLGLNCVPKYLL